MKIAGTVSLPSMTTDTLQCGGHAFCNSNKDVLFVMFHEHWIDEISLDDFKNFEAADLDHPCMPLKANSQRCECASFYSVKFCQENSCT